MTLGHTFSYIVSLPVSENVSGVAIISSLASFGEKVMTGLLFGFCSVKQRTCLQLTEACGDGLK